MLLADHGYGAIRSGSSLADKARGAILRVDGIAKNPTRFSPLPLRSQLDRTKLGIRRAATSYDKLVASYRAFIKLAPATDLAACKEI